MPAAQCLPSAAKRRAASAILRSSSSSSALASRRARSSICAIMDCSDCGSKGGSSIFGVAEIMAIMVGARSSRVNQSISWPLLAGIPSSQIVADLAFWDCSMRKYRRVRLALSRNNDLPERARAWLDFWFGPPGDPGRYHHRQIWFRSTPEFDATVRAGFAADHDAAVSGALAHWENAPESALALVMLLDQAPRHIFRSTPRVWASDHLALEAANRALATGFDSNAPPAGRLFFYLPFEHSENLADQRRGLDLMLAIPPVPGRAGDGKMTRLHLEIIERFGRFPHRNAILGRISTPEELAFLIECEHRFGQPTPDPD